MVVRPLASSDADIFISWFREDPSLGRKVGYGPHPTPQDLELRLLTRIAEELQGRALIRGVEEDGTLVGIVTVFPIMGRSGQVHIITAPAARGKGAAIARAAIDAARQLGLKTLVATPNGDSSRWERWVSRLGFTIRRYGELQLCQTEEPAKSR